MNELELKKYFQQKDVILSNSYKMWPIIQGIYFLIINDKIIYVGQSKDVYKRINAHRDDKIFNKFSYIKIEESNLADLEAHFIYHLKPEKNLNLPQNKYYKTITQIKQIHNLNIPIINKWINKKNIHGNGKGYYQLKDFNGLNNLKKWFQLNCNNSSRNCKVNDLNKFFQLLN